MKNLEQVKELLINQKDTLVAYTSSGIYESKARGIAPIMDQLTLNHNFFKDSIVADKVVGRSAAMLYMKGRIKALYAQTISEPALKILSTTSIDVTYDNLVPYIVNRKGDGMCPMEASVLNTDNAEVAFEILKRKLEDMRSMK